MKELTMRSSFFCAASMLVLVLATGCNRTSGENEIPPPPNSFVPKGPPLSNFDLTDQDGQPFSSKSLDGQPWVVNFFFTNCPAMCWRQNQAIELWQKEHPESKVKFVSITCDPDNDKPEVLKKYAQHFHADPERWIFLTGEMPYLQRLGADMFKLSVVKANHSNRAVVIDRDRKIRGYFQIVEENDLKKMSKLLDQIEAEKPTVKLPEVESPEPAAAEPKSDS